MLKTDKIAIRLLYILLIPAWVGLACVSWYFAYALALLLAQVAGLGGEAAGMLAMLTAVLGFSLFTVVLPAFFFKRAEAFIKNREARAAKHEDKPKREHDA